MESAVFLAIVSLLGRLLENGDTERQDRVEDSFPFSARHR